MIDATEAPSRHNELLKAAQRIADLERDLREMTADRTNQQARAIRAESQVRQLEQQLISPTHEAKTLVHEIQSSDERTRADREFADLRSAGWTVEGFSTFPVDLGKTPKYVRVITLTRVAPIMAEPEEAAVPVAVAATPAPAPQPDANPDALPVTRKNVTVAAILPVEETPAPADNADPEPVATEPAAQPTAHNKYQAAAQKTFEEKLAASPLPKFTPIPSYKPKQENPAP